MTMLLTAMAAATVVAPAAKNAARGPGPASGISRPDSPPAAAQSSSARADPARRASLRGQRAADPAEAGHGQQQAGVAGPDRSPGRRRSTTRAVLPL